MKKAFIVCLLICWVHAQEPHEFSLYAGAGLSTLKFTPTLGEHSHCFDKQFGFGYSYFLFPQFGFSTGLELAFYNANFELETLNIQYTAEDKYEEENFTFKSKVDDYKENLSTVMLQLPLMLQFQTTGKNKFYAAAGIKAAIPVFGDRSSEGDIENQGCYENENYCYGSPLDHDTTHQHFRGFGKYNGKRVETEEKFRATIFSSMEIGMKWKFSEGHFLYTGFYFDYGLTNIIKKRNTNKLPQMIEYNSANPPNFAVNGVLDSKWELNSLPHTFVNKVTPMAIGVKIKYAIGMDTSDKEDEETVTASTPAPKPVPALAYKPIPAPAPAPISKGDSLMAVAKKLLLETQQMLKEQEARRGATTVELERLKYEKAQLEKELARLSNPAPVEMPPPQTPIEPKIESPIESATGIYAVQIAIRVNESDAQSMVNSLKQIGYNNAYYKRVANPGKLTGIYYRIRIGYFNDRTEAANFARPKFTNSYSDWWIDKTENDTKPR